MEEKREYAMEVAMKPRTSCQGGIAMLSLCTGYLYIRNCQLV